MPEVGVTMERGIQKTGLKVTRSAVRETKEAQLWQFCMELNGLAVKMQGECRPDLCLESRTTSDQWLFRCAVDTNSHQQCSITDYTKHTSDVAASLINTKYFPNRVSIKKSSVSKLGSVCQRAYRILSHAYCHHRSLYDGHEIETKLCQRFSSYVTKYHLMSKVSLIVPVHNDQDTDDVTESEA